MRRALCSMVGGEVTLAQVVITSDPGGCEALPVILGTSTPSGSKDNCNCSPCSNTAGLSDVLRARSRSVMVGTN